MGIFGFDQTLIAAKHRVCFILIDINKLGPFHGQNKLDSRKSNHGLNRYVCGGLMGKKLSHIFKFLHSENSKMSLLNENVNQLFLNKTLHLYRFDSLGKSKGAIDPKINEFFFSYFKSKIIIFLCH